MCLVTCRTNLDEFKREWWPTKLVVVPRIGEGVRSLNGVVLFVCAITHSQSADGPTVELELHKRPVKL